MTSQLWNWFHHEPQVDLAAQWARVQPDTRLDECDWRARLADRTREPLPAHMTWLHPAAGQGQGI